MPVRLCRRQASAHRHPLRARRRLRRRRLVALVVATLARPGFVRAVGGCDGHDLPIEMGSQGALRAVLEHQVQTLLSIVGFYPPIRCSACRACRVRAMYACRVVSCRVV